MPQEPKCVCGDTFGHRSRAGGNCSAVVPHPQHPARGAHQVGHFPVSNHRQWQHFVRHSMVGASALSAMAACSGHWCCCVQRRSRIEKTSSVSVVRAEAALRVRMQWLACFVRAAAAAGFAALCGCAQARLVPAGAGCVEGVPRGRHQVNKLCSLTNSCARTRSTWIVVFRCSCSAVPGACIRVRSKLDFGADLAVIVFCPQSYQDELRPADELLHEHACTSYRSEACNSVGAFLSLAWRMLDLFLQECVCTRDGLFAVLVEPRLLQASHSPGTP